MEKAGIMGSFPDYLSLLAAVASKRQNHASKYKYIFCSTNLLRYEMPVNVKFLGANVLRVIARRLATTEKNRLSGHALLCTLLS